MRKHTARKFVEGNSAPATLNRRNFALMGLSAAFVCSVRGRAEAETLEPTEHSQRLGSALILSGGGARGAYEAGVVEGLRRAANVADGERIPGIDVVCGTSIGSVNGWFVATGQYSLLRRLWGQLASEDVFVLKHQFAATAKPGAFIVTKIIEALALAQGLTKNVQGVLDGAKIERWLDKYVDPHAPLLVPFVFTATNLDRDRTEVFYRLPFATTANDRNVAVARLRSTIGRGTNARFASDELIRPALRASAAIPILFDPVALPSIDGGTDHYVDGGISGNTPIDVGRALAKGQYVVLLGPRNKAREFYRNAVEIGVRVFGIAEDRMLEQSLRAAYNETREKRLFAKAALSGAEVFAETAILDADLFLVRPQSDLPVGFVDFDRQEKLDDAYNVGLADIALGWTPYDPAMELS